MGAPATIIGFEIGSLVAEGLGALAVVTGSASLESSIVRTGTYSLKINPASGAAGNWDGIGTVDGQMRFYLRVTVLPASTRMIFGNTTGTNINLRLTPAGAIELRSGSTTLGTSTTLLTDTSFWYHVELELGATTTTLYINQASQASGSVTAPVSRILFGATDTVAATYTAYVDDFANYRFDAAGTMHPGSVAMLRPTSLNTANGWVEGDGAGTANMSAAVATRPPPGLASANETNATNIESPTNSATDNVDMNMTTYTAAGVGASDTINGMLAVVRHGEDIATGTKAGAHIIVSNPAQGGEDTWNYGNDAGAHGAEVNLWMTSGGTVQTGAVTLGSAPVLRVGKRTATTRVVCVDFMGIYVDYIPRRSPPFSRRHRNYIIR